MTPHSPPRLAIRLLRWAVPERWRLSVSGDLEEDWRNRFAGREDGWRARLWFLIRAARIAAALSWRSRRRSRSLNRSVSPSWNSGGNRPRGDGLMQTFMQDLRYGARMLGRNRTFTAVAVLVLALGIGVNAAMFSVVNAVLLRPLPFKDPEQLVQISIRQEGRNFRQFPPRRVIEEWRENSKTLQGLATSQPGQFLFSGPAGGRMAFVETVEPALFEFLGARPFLGRLFLPGDAEPGAEKVALLRYSFWVSAFASDPEVVGKTIRLGDFFRGEEQTYRVVGVLPAQFDLPGVSSPLVVALSRESGPGSGRGVPVIERLADGVTLEQAEAELTNMLTSRAENKDEVVVVRDVHDQMVRRSRGGVLVLWGAVGFVLLIACVNLAVLLLQRGVAREREIAIRLVCGAGRWRLIRQSLVESALLGLLGGTAGLLVAYWGMKAVLAFRPGQFRIPRIEQASMDGTVLLFVLGLSLGTALLFGLLPAVRFSRGSALPALKQAGTSSAAIGEGFTRPVLVVVEVALALVLLMGTGLMVRSFALLVQFDPGFEVSDLRTVHVWAPVNMAEDADRRRLLYDQIRARLEARPEIELIAMSSQLPNLGGGELGPIRTAGERNISGLYFYVTPGYMSALKIPLLRGRGLEGYEEGSGHVPVVVSRMAAEELWPGEEPFGRTVEWIVGRNQWGSGEVVGVADELHFAGPQGLEDSAFYVPYQAAAPHQMNFLFRSIVPSARLGELLREEIRAVAPNAAVEEPVSLRQAYFRHFDQPRFYTLLFTVFGGLALLLAVAGIYGVISYSVSRRTHEIGVRMALGAQRGNILGMVLRQGMGMVAVGIASGLVAAYWLTRFLQSFLFEVTPTDPATFAAVSLLLAAVALLACYVPARRATQVDPMEALRYE